MFRAKKENPEVIGNGRLRNDDGVTLVLFAIMLVAIILVAALAIDGGQAYADRRQVQNAADSAAIAGTGYLADNRWGSPSVASLVQEVRDAAENNRADVASGELQCWLVNNDPVPAQLPLGAPVDICDNPSVSWSQFVDPLDESATAQGVMVVTERTSNTFLASVGGGPDATTARATATATMQPLVAPGGNAPFIVCSTPSVPGSYILDPDDPSRIRDEAIGTMIALQSNKEANTPSCVKDKKNTGFDGKLEQDQVPPIKIGQPAKTNPGKGVVTYTGPEAVGAPGEMCGSIAEGAALNGCLLVLPIADDGYGTGTNVELIVRAFGVFALYGDGKSTTAPCNTVGAAPGHTDWCGRLLGAAEVTGGETSTGGVADGEAFAIRLVE